MKNREIYLLKPLNLLESRPNVREPQQIPIHFCALLSFEVRSIVYKCVVFVVVAEFVCFDATQLKSNLLSCLTNPGFG